MLWCLLGHSVDRDTESMRYVQLGHSALRVSRIAFGCMSIGDPHLGRHSWISYGQAAYELLTTAVDVGINFLTPLFMQTEVVKICSDLF